MYTKWTIWSNVFHLFSFWKCATLIRILPRVNSSKTLGERIWKNYLMNREKYNSLELVIFYLRVLRKCTLGPPLERCTEAFISREKFRLPKLYCLLKFYFDHLKFTLEMLDFLICWHSTTAIYLFEVGEISPLFFNGQVLHPLGRLNIKMCSLE